LFIQNQIKALDEEIATNSFNAETEKNRAMMLVIIAIMSCCYLVAATLLIKYRDEQ
jgi:hypothetical protein